MKVRNGFVSNSSSSSFVVTNKTHPGYLYLVACSAHKNAEFEIDGDRIHDLGDNGVWNTLSRTSWEWDEFLSQTCFHG